MPEVTATGVRTVLSSVFVAYGDMDQSEGRGGRRALGEFTTVEEAIEAARGKGVQGDSGYVSAMEWAQYEGGAVRSEGKGEIWGRRRDSNGFYTVGWMSEEVSR